MAITSLAGQFDRPFRSFDVSILQVLTLFDTCLIGWHTGNRLGEGGGGGGGEGGG